MCYIVPFLVIYCYIYLDMIINHKREVSILRIGTLVLSLVLSTLFALTGCGNDNAQKKMQSKLLRMLQSPHSNSLIPYKRNSILKYSSQLNFRTN